MVRHVATHRLVARPCTRYTVRISYHWRQTTRPAHAFCIRALIVQRAAAARIKCAPAAAAGIHVGDELARTMRRARKGLVYRPPCAQQEIAPRRAKWRATAPLGSYVSTVFAVQVRGNAEMCVRMIRNATPAAVSMAFARSPATLSNHAGMESRAISITRHGSALVHSGAWVSHALRPTIAWVTSVSRVAKAAPSARASAP